MNTIAIALSDERLLKLQKVANNLNVSIEELVLICIENLLTQEEVSSQNTAYTDEDVSKLVATLLRARGFDVTTTSEQGMLTQPDSKQLAYAASIE